MTSPAWGLGAGLTIWAGLCTPMPGALLAVR